MAITVPVLHIEPGVGTLLRVQMQARLFPILEGYHWLPIIPLPINIMQNLFANVLLIFEDPSNITLQKEEKKIFYLVVF